MALIDVSDPEAVRKALREYDRAGQSNFLKKYGFGRARGWLLVDQGREYDAKAILGAAHGFQFPTVGPLTSADFHGGEATARRLRTLGFIVTEPPSSNPKWSRDELILALDLYMRHRPKLPADGHPEVVALSGLLNVLTREIKPHGATTFRNANGVAMKLQNFRRLDPEQSGKGLSAGSKDEKEVWTLFADHQDRLRATASALRAAIELEGAKDLDAIYLGEEAEEGRLLTRQHIYRERDPKIVRRRKEVALRSSGSLACEACQFDFEVRYGARGEGYIECHHTRPVSQLQPGEKTKLADLALLCANCHRMVHAVRPWLTIADLKAILSSGT